MKHSKKIDGYSGDLQSLAESIGNLHYDSLEMFLRHLSAKLKKDSISDHNKGRKKLSKALSFAGNDVNMAQYNIANAWKISKPYMDNE